MINVIVAEGNFGSCTEKRDEGFSASKMTWDWEIGSVAEYLCESDQHKNG